MSEKVSIQTITARRAAELLGDLFPGQRNLSERHVTRLSCEMKDGKWKLSNDCMVILKGKLANAQHRLRAQIKSGQTCRYIVLESNDDDLYKIIDGGKPRTAGDVLGGDYAAELASVGRLIMEYDLGSLSVSGHGGNTDGQCRRRTIVDFCEENRQQLTKLLTFCHMLYSAKGNFLPTSLATAAAFIGIRDTHKEQLVMDFITHVFDGESRNDAAFDLRDRCIKNYMSKAKLPRLHIFALFIKALRSYLNGTRPGALRMQEGEAFPRVGREPVRTSL